MLLLLLLRWRCHLFVRPGEVDRHATVLTLHASKAALALMRLLLSHRHVLGERLLSQLLVDCLCNVRRQALVGLRREVLEELCLRLIADVRQQLLLEASHHHLLAKLVPLSLLLVLVLPLLHVVSHDLLLAEVVQLVRQVFVQLRVAPYSLLDLLWLALQQVQELAHQHLLFVLCVLRRPGPRLKPSVRSHFYAAVLLYLRVGKALISVQPDRFVAREPRPVTALAHNRLTHLRARRSALAQPHHQFMACAAALSRRLR